MQTTRSVMEFGAVGDGLRDDHAAIQAALSCGASEIRIPQGIYCVSKTLYVPSDTTITADPAAKIVMKSHTRRKRNDFLLCNADVKNGNRNITITGGIWDGNNTAAENQKPDLFDKNGYSGTVLNFFNVDGLVLKGLTLANSVTYNIRMSRLHHFTIEDISFVSDHFGCNQDGLHFGGDVKHGTVKNIRALSYGQTNDDLIALNADDCLDRIENMDILRDDIEDITIEDVFAENCHTLIRMASVNARIRNIRIRNVYGGYRCMAINADGARYCRTPLFKEEEYPNGSGWIEDVRIENFTCYPVHDLPGDWKGTEASVDAALMLETNMDRFRISGFRMITDEKAPAGLLALRARNLVGTRICVDGTEHILDRKEDSLRLTSLSELTVSRTNK